MQQEAVAARSSGLSPPARAFPGGVMGMFIGTGNSSPSSPCSVTVGSSLATSMGPSASMSATNAVLPLGPGPRVIILLAPNSSVAASNADARTDRPSNMVTSDELPSAPAPPAAPAPAMAAMAISSLESSSPDSSVDFERVAAAAAAAAVPIPTAPAAAAAPISAAPSPPPPVPVVPSPPVPPPPSVPSIPYSLLYGPL
ncbi:unnamed protein product [Closterium sp. NIES-54]